MSKELDNKVALEAAIKNEKSKKALIDEVKRLAKLKQANENTAKAYNEDLKGSAEAFGFSSTYLSKLVSDVRADDTDLVIASITAYVDVLEAVNEGLKPQQ